MGQSSGRICRSPSPGLDIRGLDIRDLIFCGREVFSEAFLVIEVPASQGRRGPSYSHLGVLQGLLVVAEDSVRVKGAVDVQVGAGDTLKVPSTTQWSMADFVVCTEKEGSHQ